MQVDTNVDQSDIGKIERGQHATFLADSAPSTAFRPAISDIPEWGSESAMH